MDYFRKTKEKFMQSVGLQEKPPDDAELLQAIARLKTLLTTIQSIRGSLTAYARSMLLVGEASRKLAEDVGKFYHNSSDHSKSVEIFVNAQVDQESNVLFLFKEQFGYDIQNDFESWFTDIHSLGDRYKAIEEHRRYLFNLRSKIDAGKKNPAQYQSDSGHGQQALEIDTQRLTKHATHVTHERKSFLHDVAHAVKDRHTRFDRIFVRFMEFQRDFFADGLDVTEKYEPIVQDYRKNIQLTTHATTTPQTPPQQQPTESPSTAAAAPTLSPTAATPAKQTPQSTPIPVQSPSPAPVSTPTTTPTPVQPPPVQSPPQQQQQQQQQASLFDFDFSTPAASSTPSPAPQSPTHDMFGLFDGPAASPSQQQQPKQQQQQPQQTFTKQPSSSSSSGIFDLFDTSPSQQQQPQQQHHQPRTSQNNNDTLDLFFSSSTSGPTTPRQQSSTTLHTNSIASSTSYDILSSSSSSHVARASTNDLDDIDDEATSSNVPTTAASAASTAKSSTSTATSDPDDLLGQFSFGSSNNNNTSSSSSNNPFGGSSFDTFDPLGNSFSVNKAASSSKQPERESYISEKIYDGPELTEDQERDQITTIKRRLEPKIQSWKYLHGKERDIPALLSTLQNILWEGHTWKKVDTTQLLDYASVKKVYRRALLSVHPDKVSRGSPEMKATADLVFETLNLAFKRYEVSLGMRSA